MPEQIEVFEDDMFVSVRNVLVPKVYIKQVEDQLPGCKLVPDSEVQTIVELDRLYFRTLMANPGKEVGKIEMENSLYFPIQLKIQSPMPLFTGPTIDGRADRPAWFRLRRQFTVQ